MIYFIKLVQQLSVVYDWIVFNCGYPPHHSSPYHILSFLVTVIFCIFSCQAPFPFTLSLSLSSFFQNPVFTHCDHGSTASVFSIAQSNTDPIFSPPPSQSDNIHTKIQITIPKKWWVYMRIHTYHRVIVIYFLLFHFYVCFEVNSVHSPDANSNQNSNCKGKKNNRHGGCPFFLLGSLSACMRACHFVLFAVSVCLFCWI